MIIHNNVLILAGVFIASIFFKRTIVDINKVIAIHCCSSHFSSTSVPGEKPEKIGGAVLTICSQKMFQ